MFRFIIWPTGIPFSVIRPNSSITAKDNVSNTYIKVEDRLCGLVVKVPGYRSRGLGFDYRRYQIFWEVVGLERGSLSLVRIIEDVLERKVATPV
jgi:hypothetical protein